MREPTTSARAWPYPRLVGAVAVGGLVGTLLRHAVGEWLPPTDGELPWATLLVNVTGAVLLGWLAARVADARVRAVVGSGVLGAYTTMSAFGSETAELADGAPGVAAAYVALTLVLGLGGAAAAAAAAARR